MAWYTREHLLAEYKAVTSLQTSAVNLRFVTLGAFVALNGFLMAAYGFLLLNPLGFSLLLLTGIAILIVTANAAFIGLERRTDQSHTLIMGRGCDVEFDLSIENGVFTRSVAERGRVTPHTAILQRIYSVMGIVGILAIVIALTWPAPPKEKELAIAVKAAIVQEIGGLRQQLSSDLKDLRSMSEQITAEGKKTGREIQALRERLTRMERRLPKK